jgi:hypothetical protein
MRSAIAIGWLLVAVLGFVSGNLLNLSPDAPLARLGMAIYALLLVVSLVGLALGLGKHRR